MASSGLAPGEHEVNRRAAGPGTAGSWGRNWRETVSDQLQGAEAQP